MSKDTTTSIQPAIAVQREFFDSQKTKDLDFRKAALKRLRENIKNREQDIFDALKVDFSKPEFESLLSETALVLKELDHYIKKMKSWARPQRVGSSLLNFPSSDYIYYEPYGVTLLISPWNYPFNLVMAPLIAAIAAGNTVILKPSENTPATSKIVEEILHDSFEPGHVKVIQGAAETSQTLLKKKWDYIFFTGSVKVGHIVAKAAAEHLTPVTLELGGKSPCIIDETANLDVAAKRIVWGKFFNAGQTCIAPDYILIHPQVKFNFLKAIAREIENAYGSDPKASADFARIINDSHFERLTSLLENEKIAIGGTSDKTSRYIAPTVVDEPSFRESAIMQEEIFGPLLPVITYNGMDGMDAIISHFDKPLSLYIFSNNKKFKERILKRHSFGGGAINDTLVHFVNMKLPFGGVGNSGMGSYHGKYGFLTFSHRKSIVKRANWPDVPVRYAPYGNKKGILGKLLKWT